MFPAEVTVEPSTSEKRLTTYVSVLRPGEFLQIAVYRGNKVFTDEEITDGIIYEYQRAKGVAIDGKVFAGSIWSEIIDSDIDLIEMSIRDEHEGYKASRLSFFHQYPGEKVEVKSFAVYAGTRIFLMTNMCSLDRRYDLREWSHRGWHYEKA
jgi:hypothetical protein